MWNAVTLTHKCTIERSQKGPTERNKVPISKHSAILTNK